MDGLPVTPREKLTAEHLHSAAFQKLNKDILIQNYIHGQQLHSKAYAAEGQALFSAWDSLTPQKPTENLTLDTAFGFDTPVLKPRVARAPETSPDKAGLPSAAGGDRGERGCAGNIQEGPKPLKKVAKVETLAKQISSKPTASKKTPSPFPTRDKPVRTKRKACADIDEEYIARKMALPKAWEADGKIHCPPFKALTNEGSASVPNVQL
jgi:hypothetical protein